VLDGSNQETCIGISREDRRALGSPRLPSASRVEGQSVFHLAGLVRVASETVLLQKRFDLAMEEGFLGLLARLLGRQWPCEDKHKCEDREWTHGLNPADWVMQIGDDLGT